MSRASLLAMGAAAALLAACSSGSSGTDAAGSDSPGGTIRVWTHVNKSFNKSYQALADSYMAENPGTNITFEKFDYDSYIETLQTSLPAGNEADVMQMFGSWVCSYKTNLSQTPESVMSLEDAQAKYFKGPLGGYVCDDGLYGMPQESNVEYGATLANTDMAAQAGVTLDGWANFDEFKADAKKMTVTEGDAITRAGYHFTTNDGIAYTFLSLILQNGGQYQAEDGTFTFETPQAEEAIALMKSFVDEGIVDPALYTDTTNWVGDCFFGELCAMGLVGPWVVPEYAEDFPEMTAKTKYVPLPTLDNASFAADSGWGLTVSGNSPEQELAWDFVEYVAANDTNALEWNLATGTLPAIKANAKGAAEERIISEAPHLEPWLGLLENAEYVGTLPDRDRLFYDIIVPNVLDAMNGEATPQEALAKIQRDANATG